MNASKRALIVAFSVLAAGAAWAQADAYPSRPITIVVPYPAGGTSDGQVRMIQDRLSKLLGQPVVVDNKAGASGAIGAQFVARAKPDGYTLLYPNTGLLLSPLLNEKAGYDAVKDFKPITLTTAVPLALVTNKAVPGNTLEEFFKHVRSQAHGVQYASAGTASYGHIASARLAQMAGVKLEHVPYKGEAVTTLAVRTGEVQMLLTTPSSAMLGLVKQGDLKLLGVGTEKASPLLPGTPTINQTVPGFNAEIWFGMLAPAGTPDAIVSKLHATITSIMADEAIREKLQPTGALPKTSTPAEFGQLMKAETAQLRDVITKYNLKAE
ncbi:Bug family tripartite tricarboxylate transporter substrate binding protein [Hydrogenophaga sp. ANAO-22]|uniref:Bug family tripartite tricarboxylate transporter substrate binding protein n=1 Tax=Hydrogenophaga sp. ANAO-22 TaxID=3166645 RepID=UPI0036D2FBCC